MASGFGQTNWKMVLWDKLTDNEIRNMLSRLPEELQSKLFYQLHLSGQKLREMGWREVCLGCGRSQGEIDCGCPAGTGWAPPVADNKEVSRHIIIYLESLEGEHEVNGDWKNNIIKTLRDYIDDKASAFDVWRVFERPEGISFNSEVLIKIDSFRYIFHASL